MAKQPGRTVLIKIGDGQESEAFSTLCGLTTKGLTINNNKYDNTTAACGAEAGALWGSGRTGIKNFSISGDGLMEGETAETRLNTVAMLANAVANFQVIIPGLGTFEGEFHVDSAEYGGEMEGEATYAIALSSNGAVTFTAES